MCATATSHLRQLARFLFIPNLRPRYVHYNGGLSLIPKLRPRYVRYISGLGLTSNLRPLYIQKFMKLGVLVSIRFKRSPISLR